MCVGCHGVHVCMAGMCAASACDSLCGLFVHVEQQLLWLPGVLRLQLRHCCSAS
jgi:hypothetical protein